VSALPLSTEAILERLEILHRKLEDEGRYVQADTVWLAIEEIKRLAASKKRLMLALWTDDESVTAEDDKP
jgi:hypothetical protein